MIEWIPIEKFKITEEKFLVLIVGKNFEQVCQAKKHWDGGHSLYANDYGYFSPQGTPQYPGLEAKITHAAHINFPVEKTLEEKLIQHYREANIIHQMPNIDRAIISDFAVIAKEHYEGDK